MLLKQTLFPALILASTLLYSSASFAQLISGEAFLQGKYMEVGVAPNGSFGTANNAPAGYHARVNSGDIRLGFVADPSKDGWTTGTPAYIGDYFLPGSPQEGWDIQVNGSRAKAWGITGPSSFTGGMTGATTDVRTIGSNKVALWEGKFGDLSIVQVTKLPVDSLYFTVSVQLKNTGSSTLNNIYYNRTVDPDNEAAIYPVMGPGFITINTIEHQLPNPAGKVMVSASGVDYHSFLGLGTVDCRAKSYILNAMSLTPSASLDDLYAETGGASVYKYTPGYKDTIDVGMGIVFNIGSLAPGDSTILSYSYVLGLTELDSAFSGLSPFFVSSGLPYRSGDTVKSCTGDTVDLAIANSSLSSWTWSPSGLFTGAGLANKIIVGNTAKRYSVTGVSGACSYPDTLWLTVSPYSDTPPALVVSGPALSVSGSYSSYEWYRNTVLIPGATSSSYTATSTGDYYVKVKDAHGCMSYSDTAHIITTSMDKTETTDYDVNIYPNPAKEKVFVASAYPVKVSVRDLTGRILLEQSKAQEIDISAYSDGLYLFVVKSEDGKIVAVKKINKMTR